MTSILSRSARRVVSSILVLSLLGGCAAQSRLYSRTPVTTAGAPVPVENATKIVFEDGTSYELGEREVAEIRGDTLRVLGSQYGTAVWGLSQIEGIEYRDDRGQLHWADVRTPEDLESFDSLPPIDSIVLGDGTVWNLTEKGLQARWDVTGLNILLADAERPDWENADPIPLAQVQSVELYEPNLANATVASPRFWIGVAAAGLAFFLIAGTGDEKRQAVE